MSPVRSSPFVSTLVSKAAADNTITAKEAEQIARSYKLSGTVHPMEGFKLKQDMATLASGERPDVYVGPRAKSILEKAISGPIYL